MIILVVFESKFVTERPPSASMNTSCDPGTTNDVKTLSVFRSVRAGDMFKGNITGWLVKTLAGRLSTGPPRTISDLSLAGGVTDFMLANGREERKGRGCGTRS